MSDSIWQELRQVFHRSTGMILPEAVRSRAVALIERLAKHAGAPPLDYLGGLDGDREARQVLLDELGLGTTWFMRDESGLRALVDALKKQAPRDRTLSIWSVGCSTGEEPYSLAMTFSEAGLRPRILATDLNRAALERARRGRYTTNALQRLPRVWRRRYFRQQTPGDKNSGVFTRNDAHLVQIDDSLRQLVTFELHNLQDSDQPPPGWAAFDAIVCRNVLIYFEREQAVAIIARLAGFCQPAGYLLLGAIERPLCWMAGRRGLADDTELVQLALSRVKPPRSARRTTARPDSAGASGQFTARFSPDFQLDITGQLERAEEAEKERNLADAIALVTQAIELSPLDGAARLQRGRMFKKQGKTQEAIADLRAARCLDRDAWLAPYLLGLCLEDMGEPDEALEAYRYALGVIESGGNSGYYRADRDIEGMATMTADACVGRISKLTA